MCTSAQRIHLVLDCDSSTAQRLISSSKGERHDEFAVVAQISDIRKPALGIVAEPGSYPPEIKFDNPDWFIARGRCVDVLPIDDYSVGDAFSK